MDKENNQVLCVACSNGKKHDFNLYKESKVRAKQETKILGDSGYQGIQKLHSRSSTPKKATKKHPLTKEEKKKNKRLSSERVVNENVIGKLKIFRILLERYRNRRKRFGLRVSLIAGIYNYELNSKLKPP